MSNGTTAPTLKPSILTQLLTGKDNMTHDVSRYLGAIGGLAMMVFTGYTVYTTHTFDSFQFATGFSALLAGLGLSVKLKENSEPDPIAAGIAGGITIAENAVEKINPKLMPLINEAASVAVAAQHGEQFQQLIPAITSSLVNALSLAGVIKTSSTI